MRKITNTLIIAGLMAGVAGEAMATEWNVSVWGKRRAFTEHIEKMAELVSAKTNGGFTFNISYGGLSAPKENLDGISIGAFEMAQICAGYHEDKNPTLTVLELPFLGVDTLEKEIEVSNAVYAHPAVKADLMRWNAVLLMPSPMPQYNLAGVGDAPETLAGFDGLTVRATGGIGKALAKLGAVPASTAATEVRQALDSGVVKSAAFAPHAHMSYGTIENAKWWTTNLNPGTVNCPTLVNADALAALSDDERAALMGSIDEALKYYVDYYNNETMAKWGPALDKRGVQRITYSKDALKEFRAAAAKPVADDWIKDMAARGLPGQELYDLVIKTVGE